MLSTLLYFIIGAIIGAIIGTLTFRFIILPMWDKYNKGK